MFLTPVLVFCFRVREQSWTNVWLRQVPEEILEVTVPIFAEIKECASGRVYKPLYFYVSIKNSRNFHAVNE